MRLNKFFRLTTVLGLLPALLSLGGCSVYFAASGSKDPDFTKLNPGAPRTVVEEELGSPVETKQNPGGEAALYVYKTGDESAPGRALLYFLGDVVTICLAEYIFFPLEISNSGDSHQVAVHYGPRNQLLSLKKVDESAKPSALD